MTPTKRKRTNNINNKNNNNTPMIPSIPLQEPPTIIKERIKHITEELKKEYPDEKIELILESIGYPEKNDNAIFHTYIFNDKLYGSERIYSILYTIENRNYIPLKSSPLKSSPLKSSPLKYHINTLSSRQTKKKKHNSQKIHNDLKRLINKYMASHP